MSANFDIKNFIGAKTGEEKTIEDIKRLYLEDDRPFAIGYSGGKDSTVTLDLVIRALMRVSIPIKPVYVLFSDTLMEMDPVMKDIDASFVRLKNFSKLHNLPIVIKRVEPVITDSMYSLIIGRGYTLPSKNHRFCTQRLKILPQERAIKWLIGSHGGFISVTGQRRSESPDRAKRLESCSVIGKILKTHDNPACNLYTPIEYYSSDDVWSYLYTRATDWVDATTLGKAYADAAGDGGECRTLLEGVDGEQAGCSKSARYGCWICPLFKRDKTLSNLGNHYDYLKDLEVFRNWLIDYAGEVGWSERDVYMHGKNIQNIYNKEGHRKGMTVPGGLTLGFRKKILIKLIELEQKVLPFRKKVLISDEELSCIQERWIEEGEHELSVFKIASHRTFDISDKHKEIYAALKVYKDKFFYEPKGSQSTHYFASYWESYNGINANADGRYYAQLSMQLQKIGKSPLFYAELLTDTLDSSLVEIQSDSVKTNQYMEILKHEALTLIKTLPVETKQFYPSSREEEYIRWEWKNDKLGFMSVLGKFENGELEKPSPTLFGYEGDLGLQFESIDELYQKEDIIECESIALEDKMHFFDNWK